MSVGDLGPGEAQAGEGPGEPCDGSGRATGDCPRSSGSWFSSCSCCRPSSCGWGADGAWSSTWASLLFSSREWRALSTRPAVRAALFALVVGATAVRWGPFAAETTAAAGLVSVAAMSFVVLAQTFRAGPVNVHRIQGAVAAYLMLGLSWALAYELVALLVPGPSPARASGGPRGPASSTSASSP